MRQMRDDHISNKIVWLKFKSIKKKQSTNLASSKAVQKNFIKMCQKIFKIFWKKKEYKIGKLYIGDNTNIYYSHYML